MDDDDKEKIEEPSKAKGSYKEVFDESGFGMWQFLLLAQCGWANASDAVEIMCISYTTTAMMKEFGVSSAQISSLGMALFLGMMIGGYLWGTMADHYGRRKIVVYSLLFNSVFAALSALMPNLWTTVLCRFLSGIGAGGSLPVVFSYFSEFMPNQHRGKMISGLATFWMAGNIVAAGLAWLILPSPSIMSLWQPWRFFLLICSLPSFTSSLIFLLMPESPLYLHKTGNSHGAFLVLKKVAKWNKKELTHSGIYPDDHSKTERHFKPNSLCSYLLIITTTLKQQWRDMFSQESSRKVSLAISWACCALSFSYGLNMWIPTMLERAELTGESLCSVDGDDQGDHGNHNSTAPVSGNIYVEAFIGAAMQLPANLLAILLIDKIGGKFILVIGFIATSASSVLFFFPRNAFQITLVNAAFQCAQTIAWDAIDVIIPELFDTKIRASATGFLSAWSRVAALLGNLAMGVFTNCNISLILNAAVYLTGGLVTFLLPNTRGVQLT